MDEFEILITPNRKWKRLALLLESEEKDKKMNIQETKVLNTIYVPPQQQYKKHPNYNTFVYQSPITFTDNLNYDIESGCYNQMCIDDEYDRDIEEIKQEIKKVTNKIENGCYTLYSSLFLTDNNL